MQYFNKVYIVFVCTLLLTLTANVSSREDTQIKTANDSKIIFRNSWRVEDAKPLPRFQDDGSILVNDKVGSLYLPQDYKEFITRYSGGVTPTEEDNFIIAQFKDEPIEVQLDYLISLEDVVSEYSFNYESIYQTKTESKLPQRHVIIASGSIDDFVLNVDRESDNFGEVYNWTRAGDPWGIGDNAEGFGFVTDSFADLMNNLTEETDID